MPKREGFMSCSVSVKTFVGFLAILGMVCSAFAQQAPAGGGVRTAPTAAPLAFKVEWVRPVVKLANGTMLVGDLAFSSVPKLSLSEFSLTNIRWIKLDPDRVVTVNSGPAAANPNNEIWVPNPDLSKVEEIGFADLMPGSGHGTGGYIQLGMIEVYGKTVPRTTSTSSR